MSVPVPPQGKVPRALEGLAGRCRDSACTSVVFSGRCSTRSASRVEAGAEGMGPFFRKREGHEICDE